MTVLCVPKELGTKDSACAPHRERPGLEGTGAHYPDLIITHCMQGGTITGYHINMYNYTSIRALCGQSSSGGPVKGFPALQLPYPSLPSAGQACDSPCLGGTAAVWMPSVPRGSSVEALVPRVADALEGQGGVLWRNLLKGTVGSLALPLFISLGEPCAPPIAPTIRPKVWSWTATSKAIS